MPLILGELQSATLENLSSDPSGNVGARIWFNTTSGQIKLDDGSAKRALLRNDQKAIIGNSGTPAENIRLHRGDAGVLQFVEGDDATAEGSLSSSLNQISARFENYTDAGKPSFGNAGRIIYITDLSELQFDTGLAWTTVGSGVDDGVNVGGFAEVFKDRLVTDLRFRTIQSSDSSITITQNTNDINLVGAKLQTQSFVQPTVTFAVRVATTVNGTLATAFDNASVVDGVTLATGNIILLKNQTTTTENGVYTVQASGAPVRHASYDTFTELNDAMVTVTEGSQNTGTQWFQNNTLSSLASPQSWSMTSNAQSFLVPTNVTSILVYASGGGGGGGGGAGQSGASQGGGGGGGGAGVQPSLISYPTTPGETLSITVGGRGLYGIAGTVSGSGGAGAAGGNSVVSGGAGAVTFYGGDGGTAGTPTGGTSPGPGNGGTGGSGDWDARRENAGGGDGGDSGAGGSAGQAGTAGSSTKYASGGAAGSGGVGLAEGHGGGGGGGGAGILAGGAGGNGGTADNVGNTAGADAALSSSAGGGGGGGAANDIVNATPKKGGLGGSGKVVIYWVAP